MGLIAEAIEKAEGIRHRKAREGPYSEARQARHRLHSTRGTCRAHRGALPRHRLALHPAARGLWLAALPERGDVVYGTSGAGARAPHGIRPARRAALGISGLLMQKVTRNPIADPSILGVNSGAALFCGVGSGLFRHHHIGAVHMVRHCGGSSHRRGGVRRRIERGGEGRRRSSSPWREPP